MATATAARFLVEAPKPADIETEVLDLFDARRKLDEAINELSLKREEANFELARSFAKEIRGKAIDKEAAFQKNEAAKAAVEREGLRIAALSNISLKVYQLLAVHKTKNPEAVKNALRNKLDALNKALDEKEDAATDLLEEKEQIEKEIADLSPPSGGGTTAAAAKKTTTKRAATKGAKKAATPAKKAGKRGKKR